MSIFGWSYPPGCSGPPDAYDEEPVYHHCEQCGGFLTRDPARVDRGTFTMTDSAQHKPKPAPGISNIRRHKMEEIWGEEYVWTFDVEIVDTVEVRVCKRCGHENKERFL